jgi:hypothetical protein
MEVGRRRSGLLTAGGILNIICGALGIGSGIYLAAVGGVLIPIPELYGAGGWVLAAGLITIALGAVALAGGIYALKVRRWGWALAWGICATLVSLIPGVIGLVFIAMRKREFEGRELKFEGKYGKLSVNSPLNFLSLQGRGGIRDRRG